MPDRPRRDNRPRSLDEIEEELDLERDHLEAITNGGYSPKVDAEVDSFFATTEAAATAEADWKIAEATEKVKAANAARGSRGEAQHVIEARAMKLHEKKYRAYKMTAARKEAHKEALSTQRSILDAVRTKAANHRGQDR